MNEDESLRRIYTGVWNLHGYASRMTFPHSILIRLRTVSLSLLISLSLPALTMAKEADQISKQQRHELAQWLVQKTGLDAREINPLIDQAQYDPSIITRITTPYESRTYAEYRPLFVHEKLAALGLDYMKSHQQEFDDAFKTYGLQKEVITAILGMESRFGKHHGKDKVVNSLFTLTTGYPRRSEFFRNELAELLMLCHEEGLNPAEFKGSYAGAFGTTQFIPSSYRGYAVDADKDGHRDVWKSAPDIIHSVANYFHRHGWQAEKPVAHWLPVIPALKKQADAGLKQWTTLGELKKLSSVLKSMPLDSRWSDDDKVTVIHMVTDKGPQMALVHYNFYVITRWNRSYNYAMAVTELAQKMGCHQCATH